MSEQVYDDAFMTLEFTEPDRALALRWKEATERMNAPDFKSSLAKYAKHAGQQGASNLLVDVRAFRWDGFQDVEEWRVENVIPEYNGAGVRKFAYVFGPVDQLPPATPGSPQSPGAKGEHFETQYFQTEPDARAWFEA